MNNMKNQRIVKTVAGISLSFMIALSGTVMAAPQQAQAASASASTVADNIIATGKAFLGVPYHFGAKSGRTDQFDCSSFTQYVFKKHGIELPRSSREQAAAGVKVSKNDLQPGDLVFSDTNRDGKINHVSIYMGGDKLLHTYKVGVGVTISDFSGSTWDKTFVTARRVITTSASAASAPTQDRNAGEGYYQQAPIQDDQWNWQQ
ncbi:C40 family peptidase [Paenibacillus thiaminolyticus]|uniref:C40 family peptidase n=1 Tax=Paenibacillus thiaminolyticus TaxID=49283 RepID=UPI0025431F80|nr:C40 family peptidase [Paenibacillus thiaminolyticus]WII39907.1 C40 family peptidase [Paenibacillus thiaminolyticus]